MSLHRLTLLAVLLFALGGVLHIFSSDSPRAFWGDGMRRHEGEGSPGRERGEWSYWYRTGQLRERGTYRSFHRVGTWTQWHPNGQIASVGVRVWNEETFASERHGSWTTWHENGDIASQGSYRNGSRAGQWAYWRAEGDRATVDEARSGLYEADRRVD